ncbi:uncharacterized protein LAESUDRAFT_763049 [Laetiporus sulphureus 93-53]|uniref:Uncharacterized protein n=1 Tax=Laetiporus sulphureus 93-53 TaxID=1314785 RepID=A0A165C323_9APHY|nr:uncharacterized protein LAESUDRAFT_763049 [Laetiporus sulphureus 93-53]KZT02112.1 hypothetical protein LAESUDRAFT_763049 [Laetiporus sulphureus 93-53]
MVPNSPLPLLQSLSYSMGDPATPSSFPCPATPVTSPRKAAAVSAGKEPSPPPVTEAFVHTPSDTGEVAASGSLTASTGFDDLLPLAVSTSASVVAAPVAAVTAEGVPVLKFKFQARVANPVSIDPPSNSDTTAMEVNIPLATMVAKPPSALGSSTIELSNNNEDNSDSNEVQYVGGNIPNLSPAHPKKGKGRGHKPAKPSGMTAMFEDQYVRMPVHMFRDRSLLPTYLPLWQRPFIACLYLYCLSSEKVSRTCTLSEFWPKCHKCHRDHKACKWWIRDMAPDANDSDGWLSLKKIYHRNGWAVPKSPEASVMVKASCHQVRYDRKMRDANTAESEKVTELELPLDTPIDEYEVALAAAPCLLLVSSLPDMPETKSEVDDVSDEVVVKQEKEAAGPSHRNLAIPPPPSARLDCPSKHPHINDSDPDDIMTQHFHAGTIVVPSTKVLKPRSSKSKSHIKGSSKTATAKLEPSRASATAIEPSAASTQLEQMIELSQQLLVKNRALRARRS